MGRPSNKAIAGRSPPARPAARARALAHGRAVHRVCRAQLLDRPRHRILPRLALLGARQVLGRRVPAGDGRNLGAWGAWAGPQRLGRQIRARLLRGLGYFVNHHPHKPAGKMVGRGRRLCLMRGAAARAWGGRACRWGAFGRMRRPPVRPAARAGTARTGGAHGQGAHTAAGGARAPCTTVEGVSSAAARARHNAAGPPRWEGGVHGDCESGAGALHDCCWPLPSATGASKGGASAALTHGAG